MKTGKVLIYPRNGFKLIATQNCWSYAFEKPPALNREPLFLEDQSIMRPGDLFVRIGGKRTAAAYKPIHLIEGRLKYAGLHEDIEHDTTHCLFSYTLIDDPLLFFGASIITKDPLHMSFSTPAVAARIIETSSNIRDGEHDPRSAAAA